MAKQNLGMVTAYAYAVVGGYEGTEAEFEALLGNIATDLAEIENLTVIANTLPPGSSATASYDHGILTLGIPKGDKGDTGAGATVTAGTTATGNPGTNASVTNSGTTKDAVFNFTIPRGDTGNGIESIYLTGTSGAVKTYTILFTDGNTTTFDVTDGEVTLAELANVLPTDTASGSIASFEDGSDLFDYLSCIVNIEPVQSGSGTPSPDNVRPITGWTGCEVYVCGVNVWDEETESGYIRPSTGEAIADASKIRMKNYMPVLPNTTYYKKTPVGFWCAYFDADKNYIGYGDSGANTTFTTPPNCYFIRSGFESSYGTTYNHDISINYPSTDHDYHAHNPNSAVYPVSWQTEAGTVYGGTVDLATGVLTVTEYGADFGDMTIGKSGNVYGGFTAYLPDRYNQADSTIIMNSSAYAFDGMGNSSLGYYGANGTFRYYYSTTPGTSDEVHIKNEAYGDATAEQFKTAMTGQKIVFPLATPQTYQLDPVQVACLLGQNNVWADCGDVAVKYKADVQKWVEKQLRVINTAILALS